MTDQNLLLQEGGYPNAPADIKQALRDVRNHAAVAHIEQMERRIVELSEELDAERVRLAACGVAAMANTRASMAERITRDNPYWSASYGDVCRAVDKQAAYRELWDVAEKDAARYRWLRDRFAGYDFEWGEPPIVGIVFEASNYFRGTRDVSGSIDAAMKDKP